MRWVYWVDRVVPREQIVIGEGDDVAWIDRGALAELAVAPGARVDLDFFFSDGPGRGNG
jgi:hypothetical protein